MLIYRVLIVQVMSSICCYVTFIFTITLCSNFDTKTFTDFSLHQNPNKFYTFKIFGCNILILMSYYRGADKSLARPTSRCNMFDGENISFDDSLVMYT